MQPNKESDRNKETIVRHIRREYTFNSFNNPDTHDGFHIHGNDGFELPPNAEIDVRVVLSKRDFSIVGVINDEKKTIDIGLSMCRLNDTFCRKEGKRQAEFRAINCPSISISFEPSESVAKRKTVLQLLDGVIYDVSSEPKKYAPTIKKIDPELFKAVYGVYPRDKELELKEKRANELREAALSEKVSREANPA